MIQWHAMHPRRPGHRQRYSRRPSCRQSHSQCPSYRQCHRWQLGSGYGGSRRCSSRRVASVQCVTLPWPRRLATVSYALKIDGRFQWQRSCECMWSQILFVSSCVDCALSVVISYKTEVEASLSQYEREGSKRESTWARRKHEWGSTRDQRAQTCNSEKEAWVRFYAGSARPDV
jgi:hypothetical protein